MHKPVSSIFLVSGVVAILCAGIGGIGHAQESQTSSSGEIAVSEESLQLRYVRPRTQPGGNIEAGQLGFGMFLNEERDIVASANYYVEASRLRMNRLNILVGPVAYAALLSEENTDVFALGLGAEARYRLLRNPEVTIVGRAVYAPDILTFGAADNVWDVIARAEVPITNRVTGFGGFRLFEIDLVDGKTELEESIHFGLRYRF
jgi:hypothetical protein